MLKISLIVLAIISAMLVSCSDGPTKPVDQTKELWPLAVGNQWNFVKTLYDSAGVLKIEYSDTLSVIDSLVFDNHKCYKLHASSDHSKLIYGYYDGWLHELEVPDSSYIDIQWLKYPAGVGESYYLMNDNSFLFTVKSVTDQIIVPAGKFKCIKYESVRSNNGNEYNRIEYYYFSPGVGLIKYECFRYKDDGSTYLSHIFELQSYSLK